MSVVNMPRPSADNPLRGLKHLGPIALIGRDKILELAALPVRYVWQDIAVAGTILLIAGAPGDGKTTLLFLIMGARATTGDAVSLLSRRVEPAPAGQYLVIIEGEHSEASTSRKLVKSLRLLEVDDAALDRVIIVARKAVTLGSPEWGDVVALIAAGLVSDVAIDTVARVAPADSNDEREQVALFHAVAEAIERAPAGIDKPIVWAVAHTRKNGNTGDLSDVSGSVQRTGQADTVLLVKGEKVDGRTTSSRVTFAKLREDPDAYPLPVSFAIAPGAYDVPTLRTLDASALDGRPLTEQIETLLATGPKTKNALRTATHRSDEDVEGALTELFACKAIRHDTQRIAGRERKVFALRPRPAAAPDEGGEPWQD